MVVTLVLGAFVLAGALARRTWVLGLPVLGGAVLLAVSYDDDALAALGAMVFTLAGLAATSLGLALGTVAARARRSRRTRLGAERP